jgi:RNA polymerase sigma-70 factor, Rhodopirellula/Verrucomicrobium family
MSKRMINQERNRLEPSQFQQDHRRFVRLWTAACRRVHAYILTLVMNQADAEDLLQEVGVTAWEKLSEYDPSRDFAVWACGIARNKVLSFNQLVSHRLVRSSDLLDRIDLAVGTAEEDLELQHQLLPRCLEKLSEAERELLRLKYAEGISFEELTHKTGKTIDAVYKAVQRLRKRLFECVSRLLDAEGLR